MIKNLKKYKHKTYLDGRIILVCGNSEDILKDIQSNSIHTIVSDPPAGISFMGKDWDKDKGGRDNWIKWMSEHIMYETKRILKDGGHGLIWSLPRTSHWTATACENAGFEIRDIITHIFGSGFPKSLDISKAIDKVGGIEGYKIRYEIAELIKVSKKSDTEIAKICGVSSTLVRFWRFKERNIQTKEAEKIKSILNCNIPQKAEREIVGTRISTAVDCHKWLGNKEKKDINYEIDITIPKTEQAKEAEGFGTALKPATENWILIRKPLAEKTVAEQYLKNKAGGINIDGCRVGTEEISTHNAPKGTFAGGELDRGSDTSSYKTHQGRFPANIVLSHSEECEYLGTKEIKPNNGSGKCSGKTDGSKSIFGVKGNFVDYSRETISNWKCADGCPIKELDKQSGILKTHGGGIQKNTVWLGKGDNRIIPKGDMGGCSRFFYQAKPSKSEKNLGCDMLEEKNNMRVNAPRLSEQDKLNTKHSNNHPTVKSIALMSYLCKLVGKENEFIIDPFMGSGTTGISALQNNMKFIGIEQSEEYFDIACKRIEYWVKEKQKDLF